MTVNNVIGPVIRDVVGSIYGEVDQTPAAPVNLVPPAIMGDLYVGQVLTTTNGAWTGFPPPTFEYEWVRAPSTVVQARSTNNSYTLVAADETNNIFVRVWAINSEAPAGVQADSAEVGPIKVSIAPSQTSAPVISGDPMVGNLLSVTTPAVWDLGEPPATITSTWLRSGVPIAGTAGQSSYTTVAADVNELITYQETATNLLGPVVGTASNSIAVTDGSYHPITDPELTKLAMYDMGYADGFTYIGGASPQVGDKVSHFNDQSGNGFDIEQLTGGVQPNLQQVNGKWVMQFAPGETMDVSGVTGLNAASGFTIIIGGSVLTGGVDAATDYMLDINDGTNGVRLEAGNATQFFADWNGTNIANLGDGVNLVNQGFQHLAWENDDAGDTVTSENNFQIRNTAANTGQFGASCTITLGGSLGFQVQYLFIVEGILDKAKANQIAMWAATEQIDIQLISGQWGTRNVDPGTIDNAQEGVASTVIGDIWANRRNAANSDTYRWENNNEGIIGGATAASYTPVTADVGDQVRRETTNTILGDAVVSNSAYSAVIVAGGAFHPSDLFGANDDGFFWDGRDGTTTFWRETSRTTNVSADGDNVAYVDDQSGKGSDFSQSTGTAEPAYADDGTFQGILFSSNRYLDPAANFSPPHNSNEGFFIFAMRTPPEGTSGDRVIGMRGVGQSNAFNNNSSWMFYQSGGGSNWGPFHNGSVLDTVNVGVSTDAVLDFEYDGSNATLTKDGVSNNPITWTVSTLNIERPLIGVDGGTYLQDGIIYGMLYIDRALTTQEKSDVRAFFDAMIGN